MTAAHRGERGSTAVLSVGLAGVLLTVSVASVVVGGWMVGQRRAAAAADLAALAGAQVVAAGGDSPCASAAAVAEANGARLTACERADRDVLVTVAVDVAGAVIPGRSGRAASLTARARAGPAQAPPLTSWGGRGP